MPSTNEGHPPCVQTRKVFLHNDSYHRQHDVVEQVIRATGKDYATVFLTIIKLSDRTKKVAVFEGNLERCEHICAVLNQVHLTTSIE